MRIFAKIVAPLLCLVSFEMQGAVDISQDLKGQFPAGGIRVFLDYEKSLDIEQVVTSGQFQPVTEDNQSFGWVQAQGWSEVSLYNPTDRVISLIVEHSSIENVQFYKITEEQSFEKLEDLNLNEFLTNTLASRFPAVKLTLEPGYHKIITRVRGTTIQFPMRLWSEDEFLLRNRIDMFKLCLIYGALAALFFYNFIVMISTRYWQYLYLISYIFCLSLANISISGFASLISPTFAAMVVPFWIYAIGVGTIASILFSRYILNPSMSKTTKKVLNFCCLYFAIYLFIIPFHRQLAMKFFIVGLAFVWPILIGFALRYALKGYKPAIYYFFAWASICIGSAITISSYAGIISQTGGSEQPILIGLILDVVLITIAYAEKASFNEKKALSSLVMKDQANRHLMNQLKKLVYPHQVSIIEAAEAIEKTMPERRENACVIAFDIQQSSALGHSENHDFFETVLTKCHNIMNQNYHPKEQEANAYMIKQLGDGFLCSVGFPFRCDGNIHEKAVELAESFVLIFNKEVKRHFNDRTVHCSVGICYGPITGFFPQIGLKHYDLYGHAIVQAKRYENFRKLLHRDALVHEGNIIVIQESIYQNLPEGYGNEYTCFPLDEIKMRDDEEAKNLFIKILDENGRSIYPLTSENEAAG